MDRRRSRRLPITLALRVKGTDATGQAFSELCYTVNISGTGALALTTRPPALGSEMALQILPPVNVTGSLDLWLRVQALVKRIEQTKGGRTAVALDFMGKPEFNLNPASLSL